ncbi:MAG: class I SAM-dependent methyltransferase [Planctomycetota bacterium]|nr:class I SAM-dependent methyltransferase [Planctomycetota bacterium]
MGKTERKWAYRELGLDILLNALEFLLGTNHLHYGYFSDGLEANLFNLTKAQEAHSELILANIPKGVKRVLDVGCGAGTLAEKLHTAGYQVEAVCPSDTLVDRARKRLQDKVTVHKCYYEDFECQQPFDLVLFSESFQYIDIDASISKSLKMLGPEGHILICDFFKIDAEGKSPFSGGHYLPKFETKIKDYPLELLTDIDISKETGLTMDIFNDFLMAVAVPAKKCLDEFAPKWHPWLYKMINWKFKKKLAKVERKYLSGAKSSKNFVKHKSYRLFLFEQKAKGEAKDKETESDKEKAA